MSNAITQLEKEIKKLTSWTKKTFKDLERITKLMDHPKLTEAQRNKEIKSVGNMRTKYFEMKDECMEISVVINKSFKTQFTDAELKHSTTKILIVSFNTLTTKFEKFIEENEMNLFMHIQQFGLIDLVKRFTMSENDIND